MLLLAAPESPKTPKVKLGPAILQAIEFPTHPSVFGIPMVAVQVHVGGKANVHQHRRNSSTRWPLR